MCGRYGFGNPTRLGDLNLGVNLPHSVPRFNIGPMQWVPLVAEPGGQRQAFTAKWGLVPAWAKEPSVGASMCNARGDTVAAKPSFRSAFRFRRALMPAEFFYEWQVVDGQKVKQPWCIALNSGEPFAFGAIWESWNPAGEHQDGALITCAVITTDPNSVMAPIHNRMPAIISPTDYDAWLDPLTPIEAAQHMVRPCDRPMTAWRVSTRVNKVTNGGGDNIEPIDGPPP